jgi:hypothetical protein
MPQQTIRDKQTKTVIYFRITIAKTLKKKKLRKEFKKKIILLIITIVNYDKTP